MGFGHGDAGDWGHHMDQEGETGGTRVDVLMRPEKDPISGGSLTEPEWDDGMGFKKEKVSMMLYFVTSWVFFLQGISGMSGLAVSYFYKNTLMVDPATLSTVQSLSALPWTIKPAYGFLSDAWPIFGYRRRPYLILAGLAGFVSWYSMAVLVNDVVFGFLCLFMGSMALAVSNVIAEAMLVEKSRGETQEFASHLQAVVHGAQAIGSIIAAYFGGLLLSFLADRHVFLLCACFPLLTVAVAFMAPERRCSDDVAAVRLDIRTKLAELYKTFMRPEIFRPCAFIFMLNATPSTGATWFYFYTDQLHFSSQFMGTINVVGAVFSLGGVMLFGKFLSSMPYRPILIWSTVISTLFGLSQLLLVFRINRQMGLPDGFFCLGESAILSVLGWINTMPILVLAARLCPEGMEGTMYALIMSINNLGGVLGTQFGAGITWGLGITETNLDHFWLLVLICNLSTVLPLVFIGWIPDEDKDYGIEIDKEKAMERAQPYNRIKPSKVVYSDESKKQQSRKDPKASRSVSWSDDFEKLESGRI